MGVCRDVWVSEGVLARGGYGWRLGEERRGEERRGEERLS